MSSSIWYFRNRRQVCVAVIAKCMIRSFICIGGCYFKMFSLHKRIATLHYSSTRVINLKPKPRILEQNLALTFLETTFCWMGTVCPFTWVKAARAWSNHSLLGQEWVELYSCLCTSSWPAQEWLYVFPLLETCHFISVQDKFFIWVSSARITPTFSGATAAK